MAHVLVGLGTNVGDRAGTLVLARKRLAALPGTTLEKWSGVYETDPVGPVPQGKFLNAAAELQTQLAPEALRQALVYIEAQAGREPLEKRVKWGPRPLDLDVLFYDQEVIATPTLTVPHPHLHERLFVLQPLADIAPDWQHPVRHVTVRKMLEELLTASPAAAGRRVT